MDDVNAASKIYVNEFVKKLVPYDGKNGKLPMNIQKLADNSEYKVVYENSKIIGRNDGL